jgi:hypothetical protein
MKIFKNIIESIYSFGRTIKNEDLEKYNIKVINKKEFSVADIIDDNIIAKTMTGNFYDGKIIGQSSNITKEVSVKIIDTTKTIVTVTK